ncbi:glycosyltransferase family 2 protein [[Clostridium] aminophilum]|uniref:glycosyltransferase family 2 protein n=1 Tax=[Clostridium] aminophilum TaxID=1526 RepID=UPI00332DED79
MQYTTTIVIPNYNGLHFMEPCLRTLERQTYKAFRLLIVDNGSTDGSAQWLREHEKMWAGEESPFPGFRAILLPENTGFSGAVNVGIKAADTPYVILLNNDIKADPYYVAELVRAISKSERIFSVSSRMIQMYHPDLMDDAGDMYSVFGWAYQRGVGRSVKKYRRPARVFSACAGAAIYRRKVFEEIGYFDEMHFAYLEDLDVGYRARIYGYENIYCPAAKVLHVGSGTSGSKYNPFKVKLAARNNIYLNVKNMPLPQLVLNALPIFAGMCVKYAFFKKRGFGKEFLSGVWEGFRTAKQCRKVPCLPEHLKNYLMIEAELIFGAVLYTYEFAVRHLENAFRGKEDADGVEGKHNA